MDIAARIIAALNKALSESGIEGVVPTLEHPGDLSHGDYATNSALVAAKIAKKNPKILADELVSALGTIDGVAKIEAAGAGFINFSLERNFFSKSVADIAGVGSAWGRNATLKGKKIIVEYAQPNPFKVFHIGHLMSATVGESISRLIEWTSAEVRRMNYQGDIGPHVAKCMWALQKFGGDAGDISVLGASYARGHEAYETDETAKAEIDALNRRLYERDEELMPLYETGKKASLKKFDELYTLLGSHFDDFLFESQVWERGVALVRDGQMKGIFEESEGAIVYRGEQDGLHTRVFITTKGIPTYEAKEIGLVQEKIERFPFDFNITTVASEQDGYFKVIEAALARLWPERAHTYRHVPFGMMQVTTGKMSSRKGNVITGESLIDDMRRKAYEKMGERDVGEDRDAIADAVAVAAIKFTVLKQGTGKNIIFDPEASLSFEGDSGPYLQYAHTRACSVLRKARDERVQPSSAMAPEALTDLERVLYRFPEVVLRATEEYEPHYITTYLTEIAGLFNSWYAKEKIVDPEDPHSTYRVLLTEAFAHTMKNGLWLLGIKAPDRM